MTINDPTPGIAVTDPPAARRLSPVTPEIPLRVDGEIARQCREDDLGEDQTLPPAPNRDVYAVPLNELLAADSPRLAGEDESHTLRLAEVANQLPPILVHRATMRVIDGMHRVRAAIAAGKHEIQVRFFDGDEDEAFLHAVKENVTHGLPLSLEDRRAAAQRIIIRSPHLSDRAIGRYTGLSDKTVSTIRQRSTAEGAQTSMRVGMDGRARPLHSFEGRQRAVELWTARPDASLREVAAIAGVSVGTAHDVRKRMERGEDPILFRQAGGRQGGNSKDALPSRGMAARRRPRDVSNFDPRPMLESLVQDLRAVLRLAQGRTEAPTAVILDGRTLQSSPESGARAGYDGAKKRRGSKVHIAVDTLGHVLALCVTAANEQERAQVDALARQVQAVTGATVELAYVDQGYTGDQPAADAQAHGIRLEVIKLPEARRGFVLLPRRWVVERSFAWAARFRRLARDYERLPETLAGLHFVAFATLMLSNVVDVMVQSS